MRPVGKQEESMMIVDDTVIRNRRFQEQVESRIQGLMAIGASKERIQSAIDLRKLTYAEYKKRIADQKKQENLEKQEYYKTHPIEQSVVERIYAECEKVPYDQLCVTSYYTFQVRLDPLRFISQEDFYYDLYDAIIRHGWEMYIDRHIDQYRAECPEEFEDAE